MTISVLPPFHLITLCAAALSLIKDRHWHKKFKYTWTHRTITAFYLTVASETIRHALPTQFCSRVWTRLQTKLAHGNICSVAKTDNLKINFIRI